MTTAIEITTADIYCTDWCDTSHDDGERCSTEPDGVTRYGEDGAHLLLQLVDHDDAGITVSMHDGDDNEAQVTLTLAEAERIHAVLGDLLRAVAA